MEIILLTPTGVFYEASAKEVVFPGEDGEFSVMDSHQPFIYALKKGFIRIGGAFGVSKRAKQGILNLRGEEVIKIRRGIASMKKNRLTVLFEN
jgi:F0F1-type ATP synthase epsilon subunit